MAVRACLQSSAVALVAGIGLILAAAPDAARAQAAEAAEETSPYVQQVIDQLVVVSQAMRDQGYGDVEVVYLGAINDQAADRFEYSNTDAGDIYFVGVCDNDCGDLDMRVYGADSAEIGSDLLDDAAPIVQVMIPARPLTVELAMVQCTTSPCVAGVAVYRR